MKYLTLLFFSVFFIIKIFAQFEDTWQPPIVYKQNGIKARVIMFDRARFKERAAVDFFDKDGYLTEHIQYDSTGKKQVFRETLQYDSLHKITEQVAYTFGRFDTTQKNFVMYTVPHVTRMFNEYDTLNRLIKQIGKDSAGNTVLDITYTHNPLVKTRKYFRHDSLISEAIIQYDTPGIESSFTKKVYGKDMEEDDSNIAYTFLYKNHFDKEGKVLRRRVRYEGTDEEMIFYKDISYQYSLGGLLIKKLLSSRNDGANYHIGYLFDYKYW